MKLIILLVLSLLLLSCNEENSRLESTNLQSKIDSYLQAHIKNNKFNGSILIAKADTILFNKSFAYANKEYRILNSDSTKYLIGSITKPFTAAAILNLEKDGKIDLNDKLSKYFPDFPKSDSVTIYQLLTHTSGITDYHYFSDWKADSKRDLTPYYTMDRVKEMPYIFNPGEKFSYTNTGYILLGLIIEKITNQTFSKYIKSSILDKLNLNNSGVIDNYSIINNLANGYNTTYKESHKADYLNYYQPFSSGNMYSTVQDLWNFSQAIFANKLFNKEKTDELLNNNKGQYGYGWGIRDFDGIKAYGHWGGMNGYIGAVSYIPGSNYYIIFLTNDDNTPKAKITSDIVKILYDKEIEMPKEVKLVDLSKYDFDKFEGRYLIKEGDTLNVFTENDKYYLQETGQMKNELFPISKNEFVFQLLEFNVIFDKIENQKATELKFSHNPNFKATRIK